MKQNLAKLFSFIFHPILLPTLATILLFALPTYLNDFQFIYKKGVSQIIFLATFITPLLIILILVNTKIISNFYLSEKKERFFPFSIVSFIYILTYILLEKLPLGLLKVPTYISGFVLISAITTVIILIANFKIKLSAHMAAYGAFLSFFYIFFLKENIGNLLFTPFGFNITIIHFFSIIILAGGIIASSRLFLKAHTMKEIVIGFITGFCIGLLSVFFV